jgi:glutamate-1-semialdehyde aminotransferase
VFEGAYHGGVFYYGQGGGAMNAPFPTLMARYNDLEGTQDLIDRHKDELAAVVLEPMLGAGGAIPAKPPFLRMLREATRRHGIVLVFDEVMTSRLAPGGLQAKFGVVPDLSTFGKYLGGGLTFGAFGGTAEIMRRFDPRRPDAFAHSGTYNNNVLTMAAGAAGLREAFTPEAAITLNETADRLRERLNAICHQQEVAVQVSGLGSINCVHFHDRPMRRPADAAGDPRKNALFHLGMLERGTRDLHGPARADRHLAPAPGRGPRELRRGVRGGGGRPRPVAAGPGLTSRRWRRVAGGQAAASRAQRPQRPDSSTVAAWTLKRARWTQRARDAAKSPSWNSAASPHARQMKK